EKESFRYLVDLTAVDWKDREPRFDVVYWLHSFDRKNERIRLKAGVAEGAPCSSVTGVFKTANWMEREVFDLFGVVFGGHPDLRIVLKVDGERIVSARPDIGYLHRGTEKLFETETYPMIVPHTDRMDYVAAATNNHAFCLTVEKILGVELPLKAQYIRVMLDE